MSCYQVVVNRYTSIHRRTQNDPSRASGTTSARNERLSAPDRGGLQTEGEAPDREFHTSGSRLEGFPLQCMRGTYTLQGVCLRCPTCALRMLSDSCLACDVPGRGEAKAHVGLVSRPTANLRHFTSLALLPSESLAKGLLQRRLENRCKWTTMTADSHATLSLINRLSRLISA